MLRRLILLIFVLLLPVLTLSAQDTFDPLPPTIIDYQPWAGVEALADEPLMITFDQPIDVATLTLSFDPAIDGTVTLADDRTVLFEPATTWATGNVYTVTVSAASIDGVTMPEPFTLDVIAPQPLRVSRVSPLPGTDTVNTDTAITVAFDRPVISVVDVGQPANGVLTFSPNVNGRAEWIDTNLLLFEPGNALPGSIDYTVTVNAGLRAVDGMVLQEDYSWGFRTFAPLAVEVQATGRIYAENMLPDNAFSIMFNQPMDKPTTEAAIQLLSVPFTDGGVGLDEAISIDGTFTWESDLQVTFTPDAFLPLERNYYIEIGTGARSLEGYTTLLEAQQVFVGRVQQPTITEIYPIGGFEFPPNEQQNVAFVFNTRINPDTVEGNYTIEPEPEGEVLPQFSPDLVYFELFFPTQEGVNYTVTMGPGVEDAFGNPLTPETYAVSFTARTPPPTNDSRLTIRFGYLPPFVTVPTYQDDPGLPVIFDGFDLDAELNIYRLEAQELAAINIQNPYTSLTQLLINGEREATWLSDDPISNTMFSEDSLTFTEDASLLKVQYPDGSTLEPGLYVYEMFGASVNDAFNRSEIAFAVSNAAITVKSAPGEGLVWVTDMVTAEALAGVTVTVYDADGEIATGTTDADGIWRVPDAIFRALNSGSGGNDPYNFYGYGMQRFSGQSLAIIAEADGVYGAWHSRQSSKGPDSDSYIYTDRPIYRPGETVYFRGMFRDKDDFDLTVPAITGQVDVEVYTGWYCGSWCSDQNPPYRDFDVTFTDYGTFSGSFEIPQDILLGQSHIRVSACRGEDPCNAISSLINFEVAEFRVPEYEMTVEANQTEYISGNSLDVDLTAAYYFGGAVGNAPLRINLVDTYRTTFRYQGEERGYRFGSSVGYGSPVFAGPSEQQTDERGTFSLDAPVSIGEDVFSPYLFRVEGTVSDESGVPISGRSEALLLHPANVYIGMRTADRFQSEDATFEIDVLTVKPDSTITAGHEVTIDIEERRWIRQETETFGLYDWEERTIPLPSSSVITDENGYAQFAFQPPNAGRFYITMTTRDEAGLRARTIMSVYARSTYSTRERVWWERYNNYYYDSFFGANPTVTPLVQQTDAYTPGETAEIFIPNPTGEPVQALITVEREDVLFYETVTIENDALTYSLPITEAYEPGVYLGVVLLTGTSDTRENPDPLYRFGRTRITVEPVSSRLTVELTPSTDTLRPGDTLTVDINVTDADGQPVQAEVGISLVDEAVLALAPPNSSTLEAAFYGSYSQYVSTTTSISQLSTSGEPPQAPGLGGGGGGGGDMGQGFDVRDDFIYTPMWEPHVITDADGFAQVSVTMPDNLTRWRLDARVVTLDTQIGQLESTVVSTLPLLVRPAVPRFLVVGDRVEIAGVVNNNTDEAQIVDVTLEADGLMLPVGTNNTQNVTIPPLGRAAVSWTVTVMDVPGVDVVFYAESESGYQDAARPALRTGPDDTVRVLRFTAPEVVGTSGMLGDAGRISESVSLSPRLPVVGGELIVQIDSSLAEATIDGLDYLTQYPHYCIEQTVSRFLPNLMTLRALRDLGIEDAALEQDLITNLDAALETLITEQNPDGGWGWFGNMESNPYVSAYALLALIEARDADYQVDAVMFDDALAYVRAQVIEDPDAGLVDYQLARQAFYLYVMARAGEWNAATFNALNDLRPVMDLASMAYMVMAAAEADALDRAAPLLADLTSRAVISGTGVHWQEQDRDWWNWGSNTRTTALVLTAFVRADPDHELLPDVVRWLMTARQGEHWSSTQETAWSLMALTGWMRVSGELAGAYDYQVMLNGESRLDGSVSPEGDTLTDSLRVDIATLLADRGNRLDVQRSAGEGALYYTSTLNLDLDANLVGPLNRGVTVERRITLDGMNRPTDTANIGDVLTVEIEINTEQDMFYFVLEDYLPAGLEVLDTNLLTTSRTAQGPRLSRSDRQYWWYRYFDNTELRDTGAVLYADELPQGRYIFSYQVQAVTPGVYNVIPAQAYAFYAPEVYGRTGGTTFTVNDLQG